MNGQKMPPKSGCDGKLYFNFNQHMRVKMLEFVDGTAQHYTLEVTDCRYINGTEYYDVRRNGVKLPQPLSANRLRFLFSYYVVATLEEGIPVELPLTLSEVRYFYGWHAYQREKEREKAEKVPGYKEIRSSISHIDIKIGRALADEDLNAQNELCGERDKLKSKAMRMLGEAHIDTTLLEEPPKCKKCSGKGYIFNQICDCAYLREKEIKDFNARQRLLLAKKIK